MAQTLKIQIGTFEAEYTLYKTLAPLNADGFGTLPVTEYIKGEPRWVLIRVEHETWQVTRYHSGLWAPEAEELDHNLRGWVTETLYKRLASRPGALGETD